MDELDGIAQLVLTREDLRHLDRMLGETPYLFAAPIVALISRLIAEQRAASHLRLATSNDASAKPQG